MEKEYQVVLASLEDFHDFLENVNGLLNQGWQCVGGVAVAPALDGVLSIYQAMVKE